MITTDYCPPFALKNGIAMTVYTALIAQKNWRKTTSLTEPIYQEHIFQGAGNTPIFGQIAMPDSVKGTIVATYGITGDLNNQWILRLLGRKAYARGYGVILFDWRAHGKTAELSASLTSDGIYEGEDFVRIAAQAQKMGCPAPFWFTGYSLGGQLALWGIKAAQTLPDWGIDLELNTSEIAGAAVICPSLDSHRSLTYLNQHSIGRYLEQSITKALKKLGRQVHQYHPQAIDLKCLEQVNSIRDFDEKFVIQTLGFDTTEAYYNATSPLPFLPDLNKQTLILYAEDDPLFDPAIVADLKQITQQNPSLDLALTDHGGHVGYISSRSCQQKSNDPDQWWGLNRVLDWMDDQTIRTTQLQQYIQVE